jgi:hypothetical protein
MGYAVGLNPIQTELFAPVCVSVADCVARLVLLCFSSMSLLLVSV